MVVIARDVSRNVAAHVPGGLAEGVPDGRTLAVYIPGSFDLEGTGGDAELERRRKVQGDDRSRRLEKCTLNRFTLDGFWVPWDQNSSRYGVRTATLC